MPEDQAPRVTWTKYNHRFEGGKATGEGYAYCTLCGAAECHGAIIRPCKMGPASLEYYNKGWEEAVKMMAKAVGQQIHLIPDTSIRKDLTDLAIELLRKEAGVL